MQQEEASKTWMVRAEWGKPGRDWLGCYCQLGIGRGGSLQFSQEWERHVEPEALQD